MRTERASSLRADLALVGVCAIWGFTFPAIQLALRDIGALTLICLRFGLGALALGLLFRGRAWRLGRGGAGYALVLGALLAAGTVLQTLGLKYTTAPRSAFLTAMYVVIVPLLMPVLERVRPRLTSAAAVVVALGGLYLITDPRLMGINLGDWLTLGCAVAFAFHIVAVSVATPRHDPIALTFWQATIAGLLSLAALPVEGPLLRVTPWTVTAILVTGLLATALAFGVQMWAQRETPATHAAVIFSAEPMFATFFAYLIQGTKLSPTAWAGAALIVCAMLLTQIRRRAPRETTPGAAAGLLE